MSGFLSCQYTSLQNVVLSAFLPNYAVKLKSHNFSKAKVETLYRILLILMISLSTPSSLVTTILNSISGARAVGCIGEGIMLRIKINPDYS